MPPLHRSVSPAPSTCTDARSNRSSVTPPPRTNSQRPSVNRHGSCEQEPRQTDVFGRPKIEHPRPTTPRRRGRSNDDSDRSRERPQRRGPSDVPPTPDQPQGFGTRLLTVESGLKDCVSEITKLKSTIDAMGKIDGGSPESQD